MPEQGLVNHYVSRRLVQQRLPSKRVASESFVSKNILNSVYVNDFSKIICPVATPKIYVFFCKNGILNLGVDRKIDRCEKSKNLKKRKEFVTGSR